MASEKTLKLRELEQSLDTRTRQRMLQQGPTFGELLKHGQVVSSRRRNRMKADRKALTRAQRQELAQLRAQRKRTGYEPAMPDWAKPTPKAPEMAKPSDVELITEDVRGLFERGLVHDGESFDDWKARNFAGPVTREQLDAALGEIMARLKDEGIPNADPQTDGT